MTNSDLPSARPLPGGDLTSGDLNRGDLTGGDLTGGDPGGGRLVIVSGPSGAGKSTVVRRLIDQCPVPLRLSVSATTRPPRPGEVDGREYFFVSHEEFARRRACGEFLECKEVFGRGHWYGTLRGQVASGLNAGRWVILEIDVQGAIAVLSQSDLHPISVFIHSGGMQALAQRLRSRGTETPEAIQRRLEVAASELSQMHRYDHEIINDNLDRAVDEFCRVLQQHQRQPTETACSKN